MTRRGELRVYIGYAAGVGKTFAMLNEGNRRRERGTDVVVGYVETHGRPMTAAQLRDLEIVPRRRVAYRGTTFEEMDVDAIAARRPEVALVDELAHTNVPGSRNTKRWQDVDELLAAGIDVISTVNLQHLESINDVVERITGVRQRETIADEMVRSADQLELVDMTPEALRRRMAHGNIYPAEKIDAALANYFREVNLAALRELTLLWMADRADEALLRVKTDLGIDEPWETRERVLVGIAGRPDDAHVVRRAARVATSRGGELVAVHVVPEDGLAESHAVDDARRLVADLGGSFLEAVAPSIPGGLLDVARAENVTQIVLGSSTSSRWRKLTRGSVVDRLIRDSGPIDVHVISVPDDVPRGAPALRDGPAGLSTRRRWLGAAVAVIVVPLLTLALLPFRGDLPLSTVLLLYLLAVVTVAVVGGTLPAVVAAVAASLAANFFFTPPLHTFTIAEPQNAVAIVVFVLIAAIVSVLVDRAARRRAQAERGLAEAAILARLSGAALAAEDDPVPTLVEELRTSLRLRGVALFVRDGSGGWRRDATSGAVDELSPSPGEAEGEVELGGDAVLALVGRRLAADERRILAAFVAQLTLAVRGRALEAEAAQAEAIVEGDEFRSSILAAVSHDLRTPLASIKAAASSLRQDDVTWSDEDRDAFLTTIEEGSDRLDELVANLLDMSRLQAGVLTLVRAPVGLDEVVPRALAGLTDARDVDVDVPETLPRADVDAALLERAVANLVANACAWSPPHDPVRVMGLATGARVELRVIDRGPGIPAGDRERVFQPFQRLGDRRGGDGVGLGLAVARGFVEAMDGTLTVEDTPGGGATMVVSLEAAT